MMDSLQFNKKTHQTGFTLIEMAVVLFIVGIVVSIVASVLPSLIQSSKIKKARAKLDQVDYAIQGFITANGRLPFADNGTSGDEDSATPTYFGNLPFNTLGLSSGDDVWGMRLKYGVNQDLTTTNTSTLGATLNTACSDNPVNTDKLHINVSGTLTHMAYVVVSGGLKDEDGSNGLFDGLNGVDDAVFDDPNRIVQRDAYDDLMISRACTVVSGSQGYGAGGGSGDSGNGTSEICDNGTDDDGDGHTDCDDQDCYNVSPCEAGGTNVSITTSSIPSGYVNNSYSATFQATGGTTPYEWTLIDDGNFTNMFLHTYTGRLSGTLDQCPGNYTISVQVEDSETDNDPDPNPSDFTIQVTSNLSLSRTSGSGSDIEWLTSTQEETFAVSGGYIGDIDWTGTYGGADGFTIDASGDTCTIKKNGSTTTGTGPYTFTLTATDSDCSGNSAQLILTVTIPESGTGANSPVSDNLVGYWKLAETEGTTAEDSSENNNDGTLNNFPEDDSQWVSGNIGGALVFDGSDDNVEVGDSNDFKIANEITIAAWINPVDANAWRTILSKFDAGQRKDIYWYLYNGRIGIALDGPRNSDWTTNISISTGSWIHVAATYDSSSGEIRMYKNGINEETLSGLSGTLTLADPSSNQPFYIGRNTRWGEYFYGTIDDARIYNRALSASEISALYDMGN